MQINSDRAMKFVITAIQVFNGESRRDFLQRAWNIVTENGNVEELLHTCAFHFMRNARDIVKSTFSTKRSQKVACGCYPYN